MAQYLNEVRKKSLSVLSNSKEHLQVELLALVEKLRNNSDLRAITPLLRSIELLGKSEGIFEEKITVDNISSDDALDRILKRASKAEIVELN